MASNRNRRRTLRNIFFGEMAEGKVEGDGRSWGVVSNLFKSLVYKHKTTLNQTKNNYSLFRSAYYGSNLDGLTNDPSFYLGSGFSKAIVNSTMAFAMGSGIQLQIDGANDAQPELKAAEDDLQSHVNSLFGILYDWIKFGTRDGDGFLYVDETGKPFNLKPETVDVVVDPVSGAILGYNVSEQVEITDPITDQKTKYTYVRQYRKTYTRVTRLTANQEFKDGEVVYQRIYMRDGEDLSLEDIRENNGDPINLEIYEEDLDERPLPIIHYKNEPEPGNVYGNSELQNVLVFFRAYGEVLDSATTSDIYNNKPVLAMYGVSDPTKDADNDDNVKTGKTGEAELDWDQRSTLYFENEQAKAEFLTPPSTMENTGKLLEYYFYNIVQASETPEFVFGTAVSSSRASVKEQMPIVVQKAERKRQQIKKALVEYLNVYISRQLELSNPTYFVLATIEPNIDIQFPDIVDEDKQLTKETIQLFLEMGLIGNEQAIELSVLADKIEDTADAVKTGLDDLKLRNEANGALPAEADRLDDELNNNGDDPLDDIEEDE